jgi:hypothetical protein
MVAAAPVAAAAPVPRVAIVVGPVGGTTAYYKGLANEAAGAARAAGAEVIKVYSPNATWPAVQQALTGASIVVYLGHGNGFPSRYRDELYPPTQNGFGLNPVAGGDDYSHQYFGEKSVATIKLAPNAVVVLSHLCYASGNSEPGLPEGTQTDAIQRVDNFAAGFLRAGARAVIAEAHMGPAWYVRSLLAGRGNIENLWSNAPTANGKHLIAQASVRSAGYNLRLDPERADGGYVRSLVSKGGLTAAEVRASGMGSTTTTTDPVVEPPAEPSLVATGVRFSQPTFRGLPVAGASSKLVLPVQNVTSKELPKGIQVSVRWDPLALDASAVVEPAAPDPATTTGPDAATAPDGPATAPDGSATAPDGSATAPSGTAADPAPVDPATAVPDVELVAPELIGAVVEPAKAGRGAHGLGVKVAFPAAPGLYRLVAMLHTPEGVAYDQATQALVTPVLVRVRSAVAAAYSAAPAVTTTAGAALGLPVKVLNAGSTRWDAEVNAAPSRVAGEHGVASRTTVLPAQLVATWVSATGQAVPAPTSVRLDDAVAAPGGSAALVLDLATPAAAGDYLLLLDAVSAEAGALSSHGSDPAIIRVTVGEPVAPPAPEKLPGAGPKRPDA